MNLLNLRNRIIELMARFVAQVKGATSMSQTDINKAAETILIPVFKEIYNYQNLENINYIEDDANYPSIDLGDEIARVSIQITSTSNIEKIKKTLRGFTKHKLYEKYDRLIVYILTEKQKTYSDIEINNILKDCNFAFDIKGDIWDSQTLLTEVGNFQIEKLTKVQKILEDNFGEKRQSSSTPFVSWQDFFHPWLNTNQLFNHTWKLEGRDDALKSLHDFVISSAKQVAILPGRGGIGKTKLLYEFANTFEHPNFRLWFVEDDIAVTIEDADNLPLEHCVIVLDDAHRREQDVITLCNLIHNRTRNLHPEIKLVLSSRPHAIQSLETQLDLKGIDYLRLDELKELSSSEMKALAHQAIGQEYGYFADRLAAIAYDSPLVTVVGGQLLAEQAISLDLLERNEDFRRKVLNRFQNIVIGKVSDKINPEICKKILELIAAVSPIQPTNKQFQQAAIEFISGINQSTLIRTLGTLEQAGVLLRQGHNLRITPDVLADHILHKACLTDQGDSTGYVQEIWEAFREICPAQLLRNLAELDWRVRSSSEQETNLLDIILQSFREEFKQASNLDRCKLLSLIKEIAYYQPEYSLDIVRLAMRHPATMPEDENINQRDIFTHSYVLSKLPEILKRISYTLDYIPICCETLWQLGRDNTSRPYNNPPQSITVLLDLAKYGAYKSIKFNEKVFYASERLLQEPHAHDHIYSLLDILDPLFKKKIEHNDYDGKSIKISYFLVDHKITQALRSKALKLVKILLNSDNLKVTLRALETLTKALEELTDRSSKPLEEANQWWEPEQLAILEMIHALVTRDIESIIQLKAIEKLDWYARRSHSEAVRKKARNIIFSIPKTENLKLNGVLSGNYQWDWQEEDFHFSEEDFHLNWERREKYERQIADTVAIDFSDKYPLPQEGMQILNERLQALSENYRVSTQFLESLSDLKPDYSIAICEQVLNLGDSPLAIHIASMLYRARNSNIELAIKVFRDAINSGESSFCSSFAKNYWAWVNDINSEELSKLIQKLLVHPDIEVKKNATGSLAILIQSQPQLAIPLTLNVEINEDTELAEKLFQIFSRKSLDTSTEEELKIFLNKLEGVNHLSKNCISKFLVYTSQKIPSSVLQLILRRIDASVVKHELNYQPLPSTSYENCLCYLSIAEEYEDILRKIRDLWFDCELQTESFFRNDNKDSIPDNIMTLIKLKSSYKELYKEASLAYVEKSSHQSTLEVTPTSIELLNEWIQSRDEAKIRAASKLLNGFHPGFLFARLEFVKNLLEQADRVGDECYEEVSSNLFGIAINRVCTGIPGEPFPEDIALRDEASEIAKQFFKGSPARKFFDSLVKYAESNIASQKML
ncbi:SMEK domain-containing protein [Microcoleus sp. F8-D3]